MGKKKKISRSKSRGLVSALARCSNLPTFLGSKHYREEGFMGGGLKRVEVRKGEHNLRTATEDESEGKRRRRDMVTTRTLDLRSTRILVFFWSFKAALFEARFFLSLVSVFVAIETPQTSIRFEGSHTNRNIPQESGIVLTPPLLRPTLL